MATDDGAGETPMIVDEPTIDVDFPEPTVEGEETNANDVSDPADEIPISVVVPDDGRKSTPTTPNGKAIISASKKQKLELASVGDGSSRKEREEWSKTEVGILLDSFLEKYIALNRNKLRPPEWKVVAEMVAVAEDKISTKSVEQCKNKIDNLKKRYKTETDRMERNGAARSNWIWFEKLAEIVGDELPTPKMINVAYYDDRMVRGNSSQPRRSSRLSYGTSPVANNVKGKSAYSPKWRRVVFKISGTALAGDGESIDPKVALQLADEVAKASRQGVEVAIVLGGRNFFCGDSWVSSTDLDRPTAYQIGMMATVMNSVLLQSALEKLGIQTRVQSAFAIPEVAEPYNRLQAMRHLKKGRVVIFGGIGAGTGNPLFTTDTGAALRATEIDAEAVLKGTNVNGIYGTKSRHRNASKHHLSFSEVVIKDVSTMDAMAIQYCEDNNIPVVIFNLLEPGNVSKALCGEQVGTLIDQEGPK